LQLQIFFPHKCGDLGPFIYLFSKKGSLYHLQLHQGLVGRMQKFARKIKSRTHNFCIQCLSSKKVSPVHRHQVPIGSQQHKRMLGFIFYFHMLFSQIWRNHLMDDQSQLGLSLFFMGNISPKCEKKWFWMCSFTGSEGKTNKNWHQIHVEGW